MDVKCVMEYMLHKENFKNILLGGHSKGGFIAMLYASRDPRISTVLSIMSTYSIGRLNNKATIEKWKQEGYRLLQRDIPKKTETKEFCVPYTYVIDRLRYNVLDEIQNYHGRLILVAGELDKTVLPDDVKPIFDKANQPKKFILIENIGHDYRHNDNEISIVNEHILSQLES